MFTNYKQQFNCKAFMCFKTRLYSTYANILLVRPRAVIEHVI